VATVVAVAAFGTVTSANVNCVVVCVVGNTPLIVKFSSLTVQPLNIAAVVVLLAKPLTLV
jgi:hypothetical protein